MKDIFSYIEVCTIAYKNKWQMDICPNEKKILIFANQVKIGEYHEIGNLFFVFFKS